jgi:hypothetical protein
MDWDMLRANLSMVLLFAESRGCLPKLPGWRPVVGLPWGQDFRREQGFNFCQLFISQYWVVAIGSPPTSLLPEITENV